MSFRFHSSDILEALSYTRYPPLTVITTRPGLRFPELSAGVRTFPCVDYMCGNASTHPMNSDMDFPLPPGAGVPPTPPRQQSRALGQPSQLTQGQSSTPPPATSQNFYPAPHQDALDSHFGPFNAPFAFGISSTPYPSSPPLRHRASYAVHQYPPPHTHPHPPPHTVPSPPFVFPHHPWMPGREASMQHYTSPSVMPVLQHPYQGHSTDPTPSPHQTYAAGTTVTTLPIYSHIPVSPPPTSPLAPRQALAASSGEAQRPRATTYPSPGAYPPMGYTTPPPFIYHHPTSFVPHPSIYGSHYPPPHYAQQYGSRPKQESHGGWWYPPSAATARGSTEEPQPGSRPRFNSDYPRVDQHENEQGGEMRFISLPLPPNPR